MMKAREQQDISEAKTELLVVSGDVVMAADSRLCTAVLLLDLSAALNTDHKILINRLWDVVWLSGVVLKWFSKIPC